MRKALSKEEKRLIKRSKIATSTYALLAQEGVENFSLNTLLIEQKLSKGNFYHYFENKDDLFCQVLRECFNKHVANYLEGVLKATTIEEKLFCFFELYLHKNEDNSIFLQLLNDMYGMYIDKKNNYLFALMQTNYDQSLQEMKLLLQEAIDAKELQPNALEFATAIIATADGMLTHSFIYEEYNLELTLRNYLTQILELLKA